MQLICYIQYRHASPGVNSKDHSQRSGILVSERKHSNQRVPLTFLSADDSAALLSLVSICCSLRSSKFSLASLLSISEYTWQWCGVNVFMRPIEIYRAHGIYRSVMSMAARAGDGRTIQI